MTQATTRTANDSHLKDSAAAVKDAVVDLAGETSRYARNRISDAKESAATLVDTVKEKADMCNSNVIGYIRENPYKSVAIALGVGLTAGLLLRRR